MSKIGHVVLAIVLAFLNLVGRAQTTIIGIPGGSCDNVILGTLTAPSFSPVAGTYTGTQTVTVSGSTGSTICFTVDSSLPTATTAGVCSHGTSHATPATVSVTVSETVKAIATEAAYQNSSVASTVYAIATDYSDTFQRADGSLGPNWAPMVGNDCTPQITGGWVMATTMPCTHGIDVYTGGAFANNQYSSLLVGIAALTPIAYQTLAVRSSGSSTYNDAYSGYTNGWALGIINPAPYDFGGGSGNVAIKAGDRLELDVAGSDPVFFWSRVNGKINAASIDTEFKYTSGSPGIGIVDQSATPVAQSGSWQGGSLPEFSTTPADDFQRADDGWLGVDWWFPWVGDEKGGWALTSHKAVPAVSDSGTWLLSVWTTPLGVNPYSRITVGGYGAGDWLGALTRFTPLPVGNATPVDSFYMAAFNGGSIKLYARSDGGWNSLSAWAHAAVIGDVLELESSGTNPVILTVKLNGEVVGTYSDAVYHIAGQYSGFLMLGSSSSAVSNWVGGTN